MTIPCLPPTAYAPAAAAAAAAAAKVSATAGRVRSSHTINHCASLANFTRVAAFVVGQEQYCKATTDKVRLVMCILKMPMAFLNRDAALSRSQLDAGQGRAGKKPFYF